MKSHEVGVVVFGHKRRDHEEQRERSTNGVKEEKDLQPQLMLPMTMLGWAQQAGEARDVVHLQQQFASVPERKL